MIRMEGTVETGARAHRELEENGWHTISMKTRRDGKLAFVMSNGKDGMLFVCPGPAAEWLAHRLREENATARKIITDYIEDDHYSW